MILKDRPTGVTPGRSFFYACLLLLRLPGVDLLRWVTAFGDKRVLCGSMKLHGIFLYINDVGKPRKG